MSNLFSRLFSKRGFIFSIPTGIYCLSLAVGFDPGDANDAWVAVTFLVVGISLPWSIIGAFSYLIASGCCAGGHTEWWHIPFFLLICSLVTLGSHVNASLLFSLFGAGDPHLSCPKCSELATKGGFNIWQIIVSIWFFPIGLLSLLAGRKPTVCLKCGHSWQA
ncbi:MAG: hypothetical protein PHU06_11210 [Gallionella sp.]|nr:hypothetical protein [Gallionella sp.]MDD4959848.1 hypothetical protein [Gallionella sp.]